MKTWKKNFLAAGIILSLSGPVTALACGSQGNQYRTGTGLVTADEAEQITTNYISTIDTNLQVGDVSFDGQVYVVNVNDDNGNMIAKLNIHMLTGEIRPVF
jgi:hypothetical protein